MSKGILLFIIPILLLIPISGCSGEPQVSTSMMEVSKDGELTEVEKIEMPEGQLTADELVVKGNEIGALLEEQDYIEEAFVMLFYQEGEPEKVCFQVSLKGDALEEHVDGISALIVDELYSCDLANSTIIDIKSGAYYCVE